MEPFRIHVADDVLDDLRARLRRTRWPDQVPGIGWKQGTELGWLQHLIAYWSHDFDWRAWEQRINSLDHFKSEGIHFVYKRAASGRGMPLILTHGWPSSFLDYLEMLPMLDEFDVVVPSLPGTDSPRVQSRSVSITDTFQSAGTGSCPSWDIPAMEPGAMTLGLG